MRTADMQHIDTNSQYYAIVKELFAHCKLSLGKCWEPFSELPNSFFKLRTDERLLSYSLTQFIQRSLGDNYQPGYEPFDNVMLNGTKIRSDCTNSNLRESSNVLVQLSNDLFSLASVQCFVHRGKTTFYCVVDLLHEPFNSISSVIPLPAKCTSTNILLHLTQVLDMCAKVSNSSNTHYMYFTPINRLYHTPNFKNTPMPISPLENLTFGDNKSQLAEDDSLYSF
jgi:hypothetical protein